MSEVTRTHPKSLRNVVKSTLRECNLPKGSIILLGVSGGSDSMALMHVLYGLQKECSFALHCIGINHNLREEANGELDIAENFAKLFLIPFYRASVFIKGNDNIQEKARDARYSVFYELRSKLIDDTKKQVYISTAANFEDRAETVLLRIIRGTSVKGLNVLEPLSGTLLRPMVEARKRDVMLHIQRKNIPYSDDPSNKKTDKYWRSKVRYEVLPLLQEMNPNVVQSLCELSKSAKNPDVSGRRHHRKKVAKALDKLPK